MKRGGHKIKSIHSILTSASLTILAITFAVVINLFTFNSNHTAMAITKSECENSGYDTTWEGTKCYQWVTDSSVNPGLACDSKTGHQTRGDVCKKKVEVQNKADMEANNEAASSSSGTTDDSADPDSSADPDDTSSSSSGGDSCEESVGVFGWLLCPGQDLVTKVVDYLMGLIDGSMQYTILASTDTTADTANSASIKEIWQKFANIANIIFAVAFLIMIYSMATSTGLSNYHVKKILPKIIVMAVIVNISFYICAAALDISNIIGYNVKEFIWSAGSTAADVSPLENFSTAVGVAVTVVVALFFGGTLIVSFAIILLAIGFRHVALTVLVIISPVALSLYMLPNTEKWAKKWLNTFVSLLIVYPAFGAIWGASRLLSNTFTTLKGASAIGTISYTIMPTICSIAPAIAIIPLFKMSSGLMGYIAGRAAGSGIARGAQGKLNSMGNNAGKRLGRRMSRPGVFVAGKAAGAVANHTKDNGIIGLKARQAQTWANSRTTGRQERNIELAALNKKAGENAANIVGAMTQNEQLSALTSTNGKYTDRYGKERRINLNDPYMYSALLTAQAPNLRGYDVNSGTNQLRDVTNATATRIEMLRSSNQNQAADALQAAAATALSSNQNSNLSTGQMHTVLSSGANAATQYNASVIDNAINRTVAEDIPKKSAAQIDEINDIMENHGSSVQKSDWNSINIEALSDSKISNKLNANQRQSVTYASRLY